MRQYLSVLAAVLLMTSSITAQAPSKPSAEHDFDYLLGDWTFVANSKQYGTFNGRWSAVRLATGQLLDEYRIVDDKGGTVYVTATIRNYNAKSGKWELIGMDSSNGLQDFGTGERVGREMHIEQRFGVAGGKPNALRIRYYNITPQTFSWNADQSTDGGRTWTKDFQHIEAKRIGAARALPPLAASK